MTQSELLERVNELLNTLFVYPSNTVESVWVQTASGRCHPLAPSDAKRVLALRHAIEYELYGESS